MSLDNFFEVKKKKGLAFIDNNIVDKLPEELRKTAKRRIILLVNGYEGQDLKALSILSYASEQGKLEEFLEKLEKHYEETLQYINPRERKSAFMTEIFFLQCYKELGMNVIKHKYGLR